MVSFPIRIAGHWSRSSLEIAHVEKLGRVGNVPLNAGRVWPSENPVLVYYCAKFGGSASKSLQIDSVVEIMTLRSLFYIRNRLELIVSNCDFLRYLANDYRQTTQTDRQHNDIQQSWVWLINAATWRLINLWWFQQFGFIKCLSIQILLLQQHFPVLVMLTKLFSSQAVR